MDLASHWPWRLLGAALMTVCVLLYEPGIGGVMQRLLLPIAMGISAWLLVQNLAATTLTGGVLAFIHSDFGNTDWMYSIAYPLVALVCLGITFTIYAGRFRQHIAATRVDRWARRGGQNEKEN